MILEFHAIQSFAPANLNRDDTGAPKDCTFGGVRRARISSQSFKRAIRTEFRATGAEAGVRSRRLAQEIARRLVGDGIAEEAADGRAALLLAALGLRVTDDGGEITTAQLVFLRAPELDALARIGVEHGAGLDALAGKRAPAVPGAVRSAVRQAVAGGDRGLDVALFGRMIAEAPDANVDAACQVAHALGTHRIAAEFDYYTAVDDLQPDDSAGAEMLGTIQFNASCVYRYAALDTELLRKNLGPSADDADVVTGARCFAEAFVNAIPSGKQNTFAAHNLPVSYLVLSRTRGQWNLANAFLDPVRADHGGDDVARASTRKLLGELGDLQRAYGRPADELRGVVLQLGDGVDGDALPDGIAAVERLDEVLDFVGADHGRG